MKLIPSAGPDSVTKGRVAVKGTQKQDAMVRSIGVDIVDVKRIRRLAEEHGETFLNRVFLPSERAYCDGKAHRFEHYAARFAAKEAVLKVLRTGWAQGLTFQDVEVWRDDHGVPHVNLSGRAKQVAESSGIHQVLVSLSHTAEYAVAEAVGAE
jgi:holo-[acyl-carrier protein] synthase